MEDSTKDPQDSETSSTSSWILLSKDEAVEDLASEEMNRVSLEATIIIQNMEGTNFKNNNSDIESDGISVISESDCSSSGRSDDETSNTSKSEMAENSDHLHEMKHENIEDLSTYLEHDKEDTGNTNIIQLLHEKGMLEKSIVDTVNESIAENISSETSIENIQNSSPESTIPSCRNYLTQIYDYKKLLTWPSICTSVVIFAVLIHPYFSSKVNKTNTLDQPQMDQYDVHLIPDKKVADVDPLVYCKEIHKNDDSFNNYNMKKCIKKMLKLIKKAKKNQIAREVRFFDKEMEKRKDEDIVIENQEIEINYKKMYRKEHDREYKHQKYIKKYKYNSIDKDKKSLEKNDEYNYENKEIGENSEKNWKFAQKEISSRKKDIKDEDIVVEAKNKDSEFMYESKNDGESIKKRWNFKKNKGYHDKYKQDEFARAFENELEEEFLRKKQFLSDKEKILNEREEKLIEREKRIKEMEKLEKNKKPKGDFVDDDDSRGHGSKKNNKYDVNYSREKPKEYGKYSKKNKQDSRHKEKILNEQKFTHDYVENENVAQIKGYFRKEKFKHKKDQSPFFQEIDNKDSVTNVYNNIEHNISKFLKEQNIPKKNRTRSLEDDNVTVTGDWYINLFQERQDLRRQEEKATWWFDRAKFRSNKRNRAYWYFRYMLNRENLRYRPKNI